MFVCLKRHKIFNNHKLTQKTNIEPNAYPNAGPNEVKDDITKPIQPSTYNIKS